MSGYFRLTIVQACSKAGFFLLAFGWATLNSAHAADAECAPTSAPRSIYYGNGVDNTFLSASEGLIALQHALHSDNQVTEHDEFKLAYNRTASRSGDFNVGLIRDVAQALVQNLELTYTQAVRLLLRPFGDEVEDRLVRSLASFNQRLIRDEDLSRHVESYRSDMLSGKTVLLVGHSQGNFYANQAWNLLTTREQESFAIVSVANPGNSVGDDMCLELDANLLPGRQFSGILQCAIDPLLPDLAYLGCQRQLPRYTTGCNDAVISGLRSLFNSIDGSSAFDYLPKALPSNVISAVSEEDSLGHGFVSTYLRTGSESRARILENFRSASASVVSPDFVGNLSLTGGVTDAESLEVIESARVQVQLIGDSDFDAVVRDITDASGDYTLCLRSEWIPENFIVSAVREGYIPVTEPVTQDGSSLQRIDLVLSPQADDVIVIEVDPIVHHLGDGNFGGTINSQFQRRSEGAIYNATFALSEQQISAQAADLVFVAKGVQAENPVLINNQLVGMIPQSPTDGSFAEVALRVPMTYFDEDSELQLLEIQSVATSTSGSDIDDFEFANIILTFTL